MLPDFSNVTPAAVAASTRRALDTATALVDAAAAAGPDPAYATTLGLLEEAEAVVSDAHGVGPFMARVHPDVEVRATAVDWEERVAKWRTDLLFRDELAATVRAFAATAEAEQLQGTRRRYLEHWIRDLRRAGHDLDTVTRGTLREMHTRLVELEVRFSANLDEHEDHIEVTRAELDGLAEDYVRRLSPGDEEGTYRVTMAYPDYQPFMRQATSRDLRRLLQHKFWNRAAALNRPLLEEAIALRRLIASTLGYPSWAAYAMEVKMAGDPGVVAEFYSSIVPGLEAKAAAELEPLLALVAADTEGDTLRSWDLWYYDNEQRRADYGVDPDEVARYFPLDRVVAGMFEITGDVFGLEFRHLEDAAAWHPEVTLYEIIDRGSGEPIAHFYADLFPREGKYGHAAAFSVRYGRRETDGYRTPIAAMVANFTKPTAAAPSLLKHDEALTLFHEFGHILHFCLTTVDHVRFSGYDTEWDFVEAPSQIMEHWMWQPEVLRRFARHHETGEPIPTDLVDRLVAARDHNIGLFTLRQVFLGRLDIAMHTDSAERSLADIYREAYRLTQLPFHEGTFFPATFGHLMGGYDAGYYGYLWAKVYGDDMFSVFEEEGILDEGVGRRYRDEILATGGARDAAEHLHAFLGREPSTDAFARNLGLGIDQAGE